MKGTGAKRNVCPGSCVSTGAKFRLPRWSRRLWLAVIVEKACAELFSQRYNQKWQMFVQKSTKRLSGINSQTQKHNNLAIVQSRN